MMGMLTVYGTMLCKDCVACRAAFDSAGISYEYCDFGDDIVYLKEFLKLRDSEPVFAQVKDNGGIGVPCIVTPEGQVTLEWESFVK